eukprot:4008789-Pyramimonas_sp.AAC.1
MRLKDQRPLDTNKTAVASGRFTEMTATYYGNESLFATAPTTGHDRASRYEFKHALCDTPTCCGSRRAVRLASRRG